VQAKRHADAQSKAGNSLAERIAAEQEAMRLAELQAKAEAEAALAAIARREAEGQQAAIAAERARIEVEERAAAEALLHAEREAATAAAERLAAETAAEEAARLRAGADREITATTHQTLQLDAEARQVAGDRIQAIAQEKQAAAERVEIERKLFGKAKAGTAEALAILRTAQAVLSMRTEQRVYRRWFMAGAGTFALVVAMVVPQAFWQNGVQGIVNTVGFAEDLHTDTAPAVIVPAVLTLPDSRLDGLRMSDHLSQLPKKPR
jgi:hypothetical protein